MLNPRAHLRVAVFVLMLVLVACGSATPIASTPTTSTVATSTSSGMLSSTTGQPTGNVNEATRASNTASTPAIAAGYAAIPQGKTPEGYYVLGDSSALVTMTYYSDFI